jgi:GT2 family glycosyltransferase/SAM-dependent methyltransferase
LRLFGDIAEAIVRDIAPTSVLDVGCAMGFLVEALRDRGVDAHGLDVSEYALSEAPASIRPFLAIGSVTEPLTRDYDLIICREVLEHLAPKDAERAVANICAHADEVLFASTSHAYEEPTLVNVQAPEHWTEMFARHGFVRDVEYDSSYMGAWGMRLRRERLSAARIAARYDRELWRLLEENRARHAVLIEQQAELEDLRVRVAVADARLEEAVSGMQAEMGRLARDLAESEQRVGELEVHLKQAQAELTRLTESGTWRAAQRMRRTLRRVVPDGTRRSRALTLTLRGGAVLADQGPVVFGRRVRARLGGRGKGSLRAPEAGTSFIEHYHEWLRRREPDNDELVRMRLRCEAWARRPLISIIMPVYNPEASWLDEAIASVTEQVYPDWELCIADDCSTKSHVREILERAAAADSRIRVEFRTRNGGIGAASNTALSLATGEFVGFLDHDDLLRPHALYEVVGYLLDNEDVDFVYSDEDKLLTSGELGEPFFKPDWSPDLLLAANYLCHFSVARRTLLDTIGGYREGYDGSQDYDLFLRATEKARRVGHIAKMLYAWRQVPGSAALSTSGKPYAYLAGQRAIADAMRRRHTEARVEPGAYLGWYHVRYRIQGEPLVSVIIPTRDRLQLLRACVDSLAAKTTYPNLEIVIVDNNSVEPETLAWLEHAPYRVVRHPGYFNYSRIVNRAVAQTRGDHVMLLNNDIEVITPEWVEAMLEQSQRPEVGAVGCRLLYPDGSAQHEGIVIGYADVPAANVDWGRYFGLGDAIRDASAVTGACMMFRRQVFDKLEGFDETLRVSYNDVDFCLRLGQHGYRVIYTPLAELYHQESATRRTLNPTEDLRIFTGRWGPVEKLRDPFLNPAIATLNPLRLRMD